MGSKFFFKDVERDMKKIGGEGENFRERGGRLRFLGGLVVDICKGGEGRGDEEIY